MLINTCSASVVINEVMYDPLKNDNYNEWIELFNPTNESINLSGWTISDNFAKDYIEPNFDHGNGSMIIPPHGYAIITDHGTEFYDNLTIPNSTIKLYVDDKSIGNGLGNSGDMLILKNNTNSTIDSVEWINNYSEIVGLPISSVDEGYSLARYGNLDTNNSTIDFYRGLIPTPGAKNIFIPDINKIIFENNITSFSFRKNEAIKIPIKIKNTGYILDNVTLEINSITDGWIANFDDYTISLPPNETTEVKLNIWISGQEFLNEGKVKISVSSEKDFGEGDKIKFNFEVVGPDLTIRNIKFYNEEKNQCNSSGEGEIVRIKAFCKNQGNEVANNAIVRFYYDKIDKDHYIGSKTYENISKYQKYPSFFWDTKSITSGNHSIFVTVDEDNFIDELLENNNVYSTNFYIHNTTPNMFESKILITQIYYHSHPGLYNEFLTIYNPNLQDCDISNWHLTNNPIKSKTDQTKIVFPNNTIIPANTSLTLSENAEKHKWETGNLPDFEYNQDSDSNISQMISSKKFIMPNLGCMIGLKDEFNHTIDLLVYGKFNVTHHSLSEILPIGDPSKNI